MAAESEQIRSAIVTLVKGRLKEGVDSVSVEPAEGEDGDEYLLVKVKLSGADVDDAFLEKMLEDIEAEIARLDDRYPSVRFLDAA